MKRKILIKLISASMSCLLFLISPLYSAANAAEPYSKEESKKSIVLGACRTTLGIIGAATLTWLLYNKFSNNDNAELGSTDTVEQDFSGTSGTLGKNFFEFTGTKEPDECFFANPQENIIMQNINLLREHIVIAKRSVVDEDFLREVGLRKDTVIVNAANKLGVGGLGVCGKIFEKMGVGHTVDEVETWKIKNNRVEKGIGTGNVFIHRSGKIEEEVGSAKYVMQAVGPDFGEYDNIYEAYKVYYKLHRTIINVAVYLGLDVVMPAISLGIFAEGAKDEPKKLGERCSIIAFTAIADELSTLEPSQIRDFKVYFCDVGSYGAPRFFFNKCEKLLNYAH